MSSSSTKGYPPIINNSPSPFGGRSEILISLPVLTSSTAYIIVSEQVLISCVWPYSNLIQNFFLPTTSFPILLLLTSLILTSISPTFYVTTNPTDIFIFPWFSSFLSLISGSLGELMVFLAGESIGNIYITYQACCWLFSCFFLQKTEANKKQPDY